jgi:cysteine-S-conjugate beta-lyase
MTYDFDRTINRHGTYCTQWDFIFDRFGKADLLPFTISDMDFSIAPEVQQALAKQVEHGIFGYSRWNHDDFKGAIAHWFARRFACSIDPQTIAYSPSIIYSCAAFIDLYTQPGDGVLVHTPCYDAFINLIEQRGRTFVASPLRFEDSTYHLDLADLEQKLPQVKAILLCNPHNPTGIVFSKTDLQKIVALARAHDVAIISDEAHMDLVLPPYQHTPITSVWADYAKVVLATSTAKGFNLASLGGSYLLSNDPAIQHQFMLQLKRDGLSSPPILAILGTIHAYRFAQPWLEALLGYIQANLSYIDNFIESQNMAIRLHKNQATYFAWLDVSALGLSSNQIQAKLMDAGLAIMRGEVYLQHDPLFLRMNVACPRSKIQLALAGMQRAFS